MLSMPLNTSLYILDEQGNAIQSTDVYEWGRWLEKNKFTPLTQSKKHFRSFYVSTSFLGIDHAIYDGPLQLWETMIFKRKSDGEENYLKALYTGRYETKAEAEIGHKKACKLLKKYNFRRFKKNAIMPLGNSGVDSETQET